MGTCCFRKIINFMVITETQFITSLHRYVFFLHVLQSVLFLMCYISSTIWGLNLSPNHTRLIRPEINQVISYISASMLWVIIIVISGCMSLSHDVT